LPAWFDEGLSVIVSDAARPWFFENRPLQPDITSAVAWRFTQNALPGLIRADLHPALAAHSARAEQTEAFLAFPPD
jgi:glutathione S-transferase